MKPHYKFPLSILDSMNISHFCHHRNEQQLFKDKSSRKTSRLQNMHIFNVTRQCQITHQHY